MADDAILILTGYSPDQIRLEGESRAWRLAPDNARARTYAVLCYNANGEYGSADIEHGSGFLVGALAGVVPSREVEGRWVLRFSEIARISVPDLWPGHQAPFTYTSMEDLGIDPSRLNFRPVGTLN
ncbi:hypothetical protein [Devosia naphthalenivorans]|uniref:hypothetical protein n=1 Tax=Devosia naphthalenivorans TaxID=2082392 RepID=UPI000D335936|nr:hypothetical protein [Devosia naphthalenivorans]